MIDQEILNLRTEQLDGLKNATNEPGKKIVMVSGPLGAGKSNLISSFRGHIEEVSHSILLIETETLRNESDLLKYPQLLSHSIKTNSPKLKNKIDEAAQELGREAFRMEALATQISAGTSENADPLPNLIDTWGRIMKEKFMVPQIDQDGNDTGIPRLVIILEDFETLNKPQQLWVKEHLIDNLSEGTTSPLSFVVTTKQEDVENIRNFFPDDNFGYIDIPLNPFTEEQLEDFLLKVSLPEVDPKDFLEETMGLPENIKKVADDLLNRDLGEDDLKMVENLLADKTPEQLEWIEVTAHLPEYNAEGLRLYFDEEVAESAYVWLGNQSALVRLTNGQLAYDNQMKSSLLHWTRKNNPSKFQKHNHMASQYVKLLRKFNGSRGCEYINHLACLNFFDEADLDHLLGVSAEEYIDFIEDHPQFFEVSGRNQRVHPEYFDIVQEYRALLPSSTTEALRKKASEYWAEKSINLKGEMQTLKQRKTVEESKLQEVRSKIAELDKYLDKDVANVSDEEREKLATEERIKLLDEEKHSEVDRRVKSSRRFHTLINSILIILGIGFFYFGILTGQMSDPVSAKGLQSSPLVPCLFGVALIVIGIMRPLRDRITIQTSKLESRLEKKQARALKKGSKKKSGNVKEPSETVHTTPDQTSIEHPEELSGAETLILFKRSKIEAKADEIQERVDNLREALREIEQTLEEPLVA